MRLERRHLKQQKSKQDKIYKVRPESLDCIVPRENKNESLNMNDNETRPHSDPNSSNETTSLLIMTARFTL